MEEGGLALGAGAVVAGMATGAVAVDDFGLSQQQQTRSEAKALIGVKQALTRSSSDDLDAAQATAHPAATSRAPPNRVCSGWRSPPAR